MVETRSSGGQVVSRFYRIAAEWRKLRSFEALGVFAGRGERRPKIEPAVTDALAEAARMAVVLFGDSSTSALVAHAVRMAKLPAGSRLPGMTRLREIVAAEARRATASAPMGQTVLFDLVATSLPRSDGRPHVAFLCVDGGTGIILGSAIGTPDAAASGYAHASNDALRTIDGSAGEWRWSNVFSVMRITAGEDLDRLVGTVHQLNATFRSVHFILDRSDRRYGRLIAKAIGSRLGRIAFTPTRTVEGEALATNGDMTPWTDEEAGLELRRAADARNRLIVSDGLLGSKEMPPHLRDALMAVIATL